MKVNEVLERFISVKDDKLFENGVYTSEERWMKPTNEQGSYFEQVNKYSKT